MTKATITKKTTTSNGWEKIAEDNLRNALNWRFGEMENSVDDETITPEQFDNWIDNEAIDEIYHEAITTLYTGDSCGGKAPTEMRFATKEFCYKYILELFERNHYDTSTMNYDKTALNGSKSTKKASATKKITKTTAKTTIQVALKAFTGMDLGVYTAKVTETGYTITTKAGKEIEFNKDGTQRTPIKNQKFSNRIEMIR